MSQRRALRTLGVAFVLLSACSAQPELRPRDVTESAPYVAARSPEEGADSPSGQASGESRKKASDLLLSSLSLKASAQVIELARQAENDAALAERLSVSWQQKQPDPWLLGLAPELSQPSPERFALSPFLIQADESAPTQFEQSDSFVVDYQEEAVQRLLAESPNEASPKFWERRVHQLITKKTYSRGFDIASQTARLKAGDCSEHAVLLTALLRAQGIPARVMLGVIVVFHAGEPLAGGHAWVEYRAEDSWERLDAACYQASQQPIASAEEQVEGSLFGVAAGGEEATQARTIRRLYLPRMPLTNEGPGFARDLLLFQKNPMSGIEVTEYVAQPVK